MYWSGEEFGYLILPDAFSTGSSIMPQKKNPDVNELLRGKCGRVVGDLVSMITVMKGLPLAYNKDMQEDKEPLFDAAHTLSLSLKVFTLFMNAVEFNRERMNISAAGGHSCATECADYLASKGLPFRAAHEVTGKIVLYCIDNGKTLQNMTLSEYKKFSPLFESDILNAVLPQNAIARRKTIGGCAPEEIDRQLKVLREQSNKI